MIKPKISVIIPIYNTEYYLEETLMSLLDQTMINDIEVLMIDDGSTDNSGYIIEKYALDYDNFYAFHKENNGQGVARNFGLELAKGKYINFLDSDDYLPPNAYELLYKLAEKNESDIIFGNVLRFAKWNIWEDFIFKNSFKNVDNVIDSIDLSRFPQIVWDTITTNKLYKKEFLLENNLKFPNQKIFFEDLLFSLESYILSNNISITKETFYYWRLRSDNSSVTQQDHDFKNFWDRLTILKSLNDLLVKYKVDENVCDEVYLKWLNHDLKFYLKRFDQFPEEYHKKLFDKVCEIVDLLPLKLIKGFNSYKRVLYEMILSRDFENFVLFAPLENKLYEHPQIPEFLNDNYRKYFNFNEAVKDENLLVYLNNAKFKESKLLINFNPILYYLTNENFEVNASAVGKFGEFSLEILKNNQIRIPVDFMFREKNFKIKIVYEFNNFEKTAYLKNKQRKLFEFDDFDIELDIGINSYLEVNFKQKNDNLIEIFDISFESNKFLFNAKSKNKVKKIFIQNRVTFQRIYYDIDFINEDLFKFSIPFNDFCKGSIKKWEINCDDSLNSIKLSNNLEFLTETHKITFKNGQNKILIENNIYNSIKEYKKSRIKNKKLKNEISDLKSKNKKLTNKFSEYKSRKIVRFIDKFKS